MRTYSAHLRRTRRTDLNPLSGVATSLGVVYVYKMIYIHTINGASPLNCVICIIKYDHYTSKSQAHFEG